MSITFYCPDAPVRKVAPWPDDPDYEIEESVLPELNLSNSNALALLEMAGLERDYCGTVDVSELPALEARLDAVLSNPVERASFIEPTVIGNEVVQGGNSVLNALLHERLTARRSGPLVVSVGRSDSYLLDRASRFRALVKEARQHGHAICWG